MFGDLELGPDAGAEREFGEWKDWIPPQLDAPTDFCFSPQKGAWNKKPWEVPKVVDFFFKTVFSNM